MTNPNAVAARVQQLRDLYGDPRTWPPEAKQELFLLNENNEQASAVTAEACHAIGNWCPDC